MTHKQTDYIKEEFLESILEGAFCGILMYNTLRLGGSEWGGLNLGSLEESILAFTALFFIDGKFKRIRDDSSELPRTIVQASTFGVAYNLLECAGSYMF